MLLFKTIILFLVTIYVHALPQSLGQRIVDGTEADITDAPYQVGLLLDIYDNGQVFELICGGSIIAESVILTAAHCSEWTFFDQWRVRAGTTWSQSLGQYKNVSKIVLHPSYDGHDYDIGLYILESPLTFTTARTAIIPLPEQGAAVDYGAVGFVTGWGGTRDGAPTVNTLRKAMIPLLNQNDCVSALQGYARVTDRMFCAGVLNTPAQTAPCDGDFGGPLAIDGVLIGVTSWGRSCGRYGQPSVWVKVSEFRSWIDSEISKI